MNKERQRQQIQRYIDTLEARLEWHREAISKYQDIEKTLLREIEELEELLYSVK